MAKLDGAGTGMDMGLVSPRKQMAMGGAMPAGGNFGADQGGSGGVTPMPHVDAAMDTGAHLPEGSRGAKGPRQDGDDGRGRPRPAQVHAPLRLR